jgi:hypothetical protein
MLHPINNSQGNTGKLTCNANDDTSDNKSNGRMCLEYLGKLKDASPCAQNGIPAGPSSKGAKVPALVR